MKQIIAVIILLTIALPVRAQLPSGFEPMEKDLIQKQLLEEELSKSSQAQEGKAQPAKKSSNWWKWGLGILIVGGIAAAAGGGGGGGGGTSTGTIQVGW